MPPNQSSKYDLSLRSVFSCFPKTQKLLAINLLVSILPVFFFFLFFFSLFRVAVIVIVVALSFCKKFEFFFQVGSGGSAQR